MTEHKGLPVHGYAPQSADKVAIVNQNKELEERVLRQIDAMQSKVGGNDQLWIVSHWWLIVIPLGLLIGLAIPVPERAELTAEAVCARQRVTEGNWMVKPQSLTPYCAALVEKMKRETK